MTDVRRKLLHLALALGAFLMVVPYAWQMSTSLKTFAESARIPPTVFPEDPFFGNFPEVFEVVPFASMMGVSVVMAVGRMAGQLVFCALAAFAFARMPFRGSNVLFVVFLSVMMVPEELYIIPQYEIMQSLGWLDSLPALIVPRMFNVFGIFLLRQFFLSLPAELGDAAKIDGAGPLRIFWSVYLPLAKPGLITLAIFSALASWKDLLWPLIVNSSPDKLPLTAGLANLAGEFYVEYPVLMAGSLLAMLPLILTFLFLQRHFIQGIATTGGKS